jgi:nucleotide-binding universal stress UspA family protein
METGVILVPIDFDPGSDRALELAKELAQGLGQELVLVHVYQLPVFAYPGIEATTVPAILPQVASAARRALDQFARERGIHRSLVREGHIATEILAVAKELGAKMIVMATHGRTGIAHALLGSITERVVRESPIPVVTVRSPAKS